MACSLCNRHAVQTAALTGSNILQEEPSSPPTTAKSSDLCFRIFVIFTLIVTGGTIIVGGLALAATKGAFPLSMTDFAQLAVIGEVNSYMMIVGGVALLALAIFSWIRHLRKSGHPLSGH